MSGWGLFLLFSVPGTGRAPWGPRAVPSRAGVGLQRRAQAGSGDGGHRGDAGVGLWAAWVCSAVMDGKDYMSVYRMCAQGKV